MCSFLIEAFYMFQYFLNRYQVFIHCKLNVNIFIEGTYFCLSLGVSTRES